MAYYTLFHAYGNLQVKIAVDMKQIGTVRAVMLKVVYLLDLSSQFSCRGEYEDLCLS